jgi:hypothetical protein
MKEALIYSAIIPPLSIFCAAESHGYSAKLSGALTPSRKDAKNLMLCAFALDGCCRNLPKLLLYTRATQQPQKPQSF